MHLVLGDVLLLHRPEGAEPHMKQHFLHLYALLPDAFKQFPG